LLPSISSLFRANILDKKHLSCCIYHFLVRFLISKKYWPVRKEQAQTLSFLIKSNL
jgi:hypothetical protein